ncbi:hypothetical protein [Natrarchaeobius chitinivorans]|uniref:Uncharacterized protein n=1 Tax=Natrarchaeobius chitinivorans TaxID=1679083 RepID=A0A3N6LQL4_NATCH|nr:hypothetical protein [Natrarchaeobius chitinivorans]RQG90587.1 hypothetical protein EA473_20775 [Natrarchaeobius chitinivorans]
MDRFGRRDAIVAAAAGGTAAVAGCLGSRTGNGSGSTDDGTENGDGSPTVETFQLGPSLERPLWAADEERTGFVSVAESERDALWPVEDPEEIDGLEEWFAEIDFEESTVVVVQTVGPNTCYGEIEIDDVSVDVRDGSGEGGDDDRVVTGTARAVDVSDDDEACGQAVTYPSALVRVTGEDRPTAATFTITDGWGETTEVDSSAELVDPDLLPGLVRPSTEPSAVPSTLECDDDEFERLWSQGDDVAWGEVRDDDGTPLLAMRIDDGGRSDDESERLQFEYGDEIDVWMRNVSTSHVLTGNASKYSLERSTDDGWIEVRGTIGDATFGYTDEGISHPPGEGFEWTLELTEAGILEDHFRGEDLEICPDLEAGRYRFAYWGAPGDEPLAVAFDLVK